MNFFDLKDELFINEMMFGMWDESYVNADPTAFESHKLRVAFIMRMLDSYDSNSFQNAVKVTF